MKIHLIADELFRELGEPTSYSVPAIAFWLRNHIGDVNLLIGTEFEIDSDSVTILPDIGESEKSIFKKLFEIYYYNKLASQFLGAASQDIVTEISSDGATIRMVNKNELSKSYMALKKDALNDLRELINGYNVNSVTFAQVVGDDTVGSNNSINRDRYNRL